MGRQPCCDKLGLKRGPWTIEEDHKLMCFILNNGIQCWRNVPKLAGLSRCGKSCRLRWINYLRPDLKRGALSEMEENQIIELHARLGNRWSKIASHFPGRTDNEIKNHWNTRIKKRLKFQGVDPVTHEPIVHEESKEMINESNIRSNLQNEKIINIDLPIQENAQIAESAVDEAKDETLINNCDLWMMNFQEIINPTLTCYSSSFSIEDSVTSCANSSGKSVASIIDESSMMQQWIESVDSVLSYGFNGQQFFTNF